MLRGRCSSILLSLAVVAPLSAQTPDPYEAKVQGLAHPRYAEREKAARELIAIGEPALKSLRAVSSSPDPELRARAAIVAEKIDRAVRSERLLVASKLAIKLDKVPLQQALAQVSQKSGLRFHLDSSKETNSQRPITLDTGEVPFWEAVHAFYSAAGLVENDIPTADVTSDSRRTRLYAETLSGRARGDVIRVIDRKSALTRSTASEFTAKAIRVRALPAAFPQNKFDAATGECTLNLDVDAAPNLPIQELIGVEIKRAMTDERQVLAPAYPVAPYQSGFYGMEQMLVARQIVINGDLIMEDGVGGSPFYPVTLKAGTSHPRKLSELDGVVVARMLAQTEPLITVPDVFGKAKEQSFRSEGHSFQIIDAKPGSLHVRVTTSADSINEILNLAVQVKGRMQPFVRINRRSGGSSQSAPEFQLRDSDGKIIKTTTQVTGSANDGTTVTFEVLLRVDKSASTTSNASLTMTGRRSVIVEMPFVLKDVELP